MKFKLRAFFLALVAVCFAWLAPAQDGAIAADKTLVLRPATERLAVISGALSLTKSQKEKIRAILEEVNAAVRKKIESGNAKIIAVLDEEQGENFAGIEEEGNCGAQAARPAQRLRPAGSFSGQEKRGQSGEGRQGKGQQGGSRQGAGQGRMGQSGGNNNMEDGMAPKPKGKCGDGICGVMERNNPDLCPEDCADN